MTIDLADAMRLHPSALAGERPVVGPQVIDDPRPGFARSPRKSARPKGPPPTSRSSLGGPAPFDPRPVGSVPPTIVAYHRKGES